MKKLVTVQLFYTGSEGYYEALALGAGNIMLLPEKKTTNEIYVAEISDEMSQAERSSLISQGMKNAHVEAKEFMQSEFGENYWKRGISYWFGELQFSEEAYPDESDGYWDY